LRTFSAGIEVHCGLAKTGVVGTLRGRGQSSRAIGLRADIDALNITEKTSLEYASRVPGKMHACGHDGHTVMLLGAALYLAKSRNFDGVVQFIFQPAEENEGGGKVMIEDGLFENFPVDSVYALHNWPGLPVGEAAVRAGPVMASYDIF
jgi:hippurate hydrolase